jgi:hypothetical protein
MADAGAAGSAVSTPSKQQQQQSNNHEQQVRTWEDENDACCLDAPYSLRV